VTETPEHAACRTRTPEEQRAAFFAKLRAQIRAFRATFPYEYADATRAATVSNIARTGRASVIEVGQ
jgi:hypothetical protein